MWRDYDERYSRGYPRGGRGMGRGYGRGYGRGMGRGYGMGYGRGYEPYDDYADDYYRGPTLDEEIRELEDYRNYLQDELAFIEKRLQDLKKENGGE